MGADCWRSTQVVQRGLILKSGNTTLRNAMTIIMAKLTCWRSQWPTAWSWPEQYLDWLGARLPKCAAKVPPLCPQRCHIQYFAQAPSSPWPAWAPHASLQVLHTNTQQSDECEHINILLTFVCYRGSCWVADCVKMFFIPVITMPRMALESTSFSLTSRE